MKNLKIEIHLSSAAIVPTMPFDSILARLYFDKQKEVLDDEIAYLNYLNQQMNKF